MSLINQALKEEQRRRTVPAVAAAPMVARMQRNRDKSPMVLVVFAGAGLLLAALAVYLIYAGTQFLDQVQVASPAAAAPVAAESAPVDSRPSVAEIEPAETPVEVVDPEPLATVSDKDAEATTLDHPEIAPEPRASPVVTEEQIQNQKIVDAFRIQGVRKSGQDTRVFLNGKLQRLGDVVDLATGITLTGYTDTELVFEDRTGFIYRKPI